jgi:hypothetical protein
MVDFPNVRAEIEVCSIRSIIGRLCGYCIAKGKGEEKGEAGKRQTKKLEEKGVLSESLSCYSPLYTKLDSLKA